MTLSIFRALATECRRDIALLSTSLLSSVNEVLAAVSTDLEVVVRAAGLVCIDTPMNIFGVYSRILHSLQPGPHIQMATS